MSKPSQTLIPQYKPRMRGAVLVEFAIVLPLLMLLAFGITELGRALYQLNGLNKATISGARYLARLHGAVDVSDGNCNKDTAWDTTAAANVVIYGNETGTGEALMPGVTVSFNVEPRSRDIDGVTATGCVIKATASANFVSVLGDTVIPFSAIDEGMLPITLTANVEERYIGE